MHDLLIEQLSQSSLRHQTRGKILQQLKIKAILIEKFIPHLHHENNIIRWEMVNLFGTLKYHQAIEPIINLICTDPDPHVRWRGMWALTSIGDKEHISGLLINIKNNSIISWIERWNATVGLNLINPNYDCFDMFNQGLNYKSERRGKSEFPAQPEIEALSSMGGGNLKFPPASDWIQFEAANCLSRSLPSCDPNSPIINQILTQLIDLVEREDLWITTRSECLKAISKFPSLEKTKPILLNWTKTHPHDRLKRRAKELIK